MRLLCTVLILLCAVSTAFASTNVGWSPTDCVMGEPDPAVDADRDGLNDDCEFELASAFRPQLIFSDGGFIGGLFGGENATDRFSFWAVRSAGADRYQIYYALAYYEDTGRHGLEAHLGDTEFVVVEVSHVHLTDWQVERVFLSAHFKNPTDPYRDGDRALWLDHTVFEWQDHHRGRARVHVAERKHGNFPSRAACNDARILHVLLGIEGPLDVRVDLCRGGQSGEQFEVRPDANLGSRRHQIVDQPVAHDGNGDGLDELEWFFDDTAPFCGWQVDTGPNDRDDQDCVDGGINLYAAQLGDFGFDPVGGDYCEACENGCADDRTCLRGQCVAACTQDADCPQNWGCQQGACHEEVWTCRDGARWRSQCGEPIVEDVCPVGFGCVEGRCDADERHVRSLPNPGDVALCIDQGGGGFTANTELTLVFVDPVVGAASRENTVVTDAAGHFEWQFGLGCADPDARARAAAFLDRVDPNRVGFQERPIRYYAEWWNGALERTEPVEVRLSFGGACVPDCTNAECGSDGCGGTCGICGGTDTCAAGACAPVGNAQDAWFGQIAGNVTWRLADSPIHVSGDLTVTGSLTIEPGVVVMFESATTDLTILDGGQLTADGTANQPIVFTSDGERAPESWGGVYVRGSAGEVRIAHAEFRYGGYDSNSSVDYALRVDGTARPSLSDLRFRSNRRNGIGLTAGIYSRDLYLDAVGVPYLLDGDATVNAGVTMTVAPGVVLKFESRTADLLINGRLVADGQSGQPIVFTSLRDDLLLDSGNDGQTPVAVEQWGGIYFAPSASAPSVVRHAVVRYGGYDSNSSIDFPIHVDGGVNPVIESTVLSGNRVNAIGLSTGAYEIDVRLDVVGIAYWIRNDITMNPGTTLTVEPGVIVKFQSSTDDLHVNGRLVAQGTPQQEIVFTSGRDDAKGGDSDNNGNRPAAPSNWGGIHLNANGAQADSILAHVVIRFAGYDSNSSVDFPLYVDGTTQPQITDTRIERSRVNGIGLEAGEYAHDLALNIVGLAYWIRTDLIVNAGVTMRVDPGVVVKFQSSTDDLYVRGRLVAEGTPNAPIIFTGPRDDSVGGDTNADGASQPNAQSWGGIHLDASATPSSVEHVEVRYAGYESNSSLDFPVVIDPTTRHALSNVRLWRNRVNALAMETGAYAHDLWLDNFELPWWIESDVTINAGVTMTVAPGTVVKFGSSTDDLWVYGRLVARGTPNRPIYFSSARDDLLLGDTNFDGRTATGPEQWGGIFLDRDETTPASIVEHAVFRFGGYDSNSSADFPMLIDAAGAHQLHHLSFQGNRMNGVAINWGAYDRDIVLSNPGAAYWIESDVTARGNLTIAPGTVIKFRDVNDDLLVRGRLQAQGEVDAPIVFTSSEDDAWAGDTNADGISGAQSGDWGGIQLGEESSGHRLRHVVLSYGGSEDPDSSVCALYVFGTDTLIEHTRFAENDDAICLAGAAELDLGGGPAGSDGGNSFSPNRAQGDWTVYNNTPRDVSAYDNDWGIANGQIESIIYDRTDNATRGEVLYDRPPIALGAVVSTDEDVAVPAPLQGQDPDGTPITFQIVAHPANGVLLGDAPNLIYQPGADFHGDDFFSFRVSDGASQSAPAEVRITVRPVNDAPVAIGEQVALLEDTAQAVMLEGSDADGDPLTFAIVGHPERGLLEGVPPAVTYRPEAGFNGVDTVRFTVSDGQLTSASATVRLTVQAVDDRPNAFPQAAQTQEDTPFDIVLAGSDPEGQPLTWRIETPPDMGQLVGDGPVMRFTPPADWSGQTQFEFTTFDGALRSSPAAVQITVLAMPDAPVALAQILETQEDSALPVTLSGTDADGDALTYRIATEPAEGELLGVAPNLVYQPGANAHGWVSFEFEVSDMSGRSDSAEVRIRVLSVNDAPTATALQLETDEDTAIALVLAGADPDGDPLIVRIVQEPQSGELIGELPALEYVPAADASGEFEVRFVVSDGQVESAPATAHITVHPINDAPRIQPIADQQNLRGDLVEIVLAAIDPEADPIAWRAYDLPPGLELDEGGPRITGELVAEAVGVWQTRITATDPAGATSQVMLRWTVDRGNLAPRILAFDPVLAFEGAAVRLEALVEDSDGDPLVYHWTFGDGSPVISGAGLGGIEHTYADDGRYTAHLRVEDADSAVEQTIDVTILNVAPRFVSQPPVALAGDADLGYRLIADDPGADAIEFELIDAPAGARLDDDQLIWRPTAAQRLSGPHAFAVQARDEDGGFADQAWMLVVDFLDADDDGMPDDCEVRYGLDPADPNDAALDLDRDGIDNQTECRSGGDPTRFDGPSAPALEAPLLGERLAEQRPELRVRNAVDPNEDGLTYHFEVYDNPDLAGAPILVSDAMAEGLETTSWRTPEALPDNTRFWWRARAADNHVQGAWSETGWALVDQMNEAPSTPIPSTPLGRAEVRQPEFEASVAFDPEADPVMYVFEIYSDVMLGELIATGQAANPNWRIDVRLAEDTTYWWRCAAEDDLGAMSAWSDVVQVRVDAENTLPGAPTILAPMRDAIVGELPAVLRWLPPIDPDEDTLSYRVEVVDSAGQRVLEIDPFRPDSPAPYAVSLPGLREDDTFIVRVQARDRAGLGPAAEVRFTVNAENTAPSAPRLLTPADEALHPIGSVVFAFEAATDFDEEPVSHRLDVRRIDDQAIMWTTHNVAINAGRGRVQWDDAEPGQRYSWQVQATDTRGLDGAVGGPRLLRIEAPANRPPSPPVALSPIGGPALAPDAVTLRVLNANDPDGDPLTYAFELFEDAALEVSIWRVEAVEPGEGETAVMPEGLEAYRGAKVYWLARASDDSGASGAASVVAHFDIAEEDLDLGILDGGMASDAANLDMGVEADVAFMEDAGEADAEEPDQMVADAGADARMIDAEVDAAIFDGGRGEDAMPSESDAMQTAPQPAGDCSSSGPQRGERGLFLVVLLGYVLRRRSNN